MASPSSVHQEVAEVELSAVGQEIEGARARRKVERRRPGLAEIIRRAREELAAYTQLKLASTLAAVREEHQWRVSIEMVEKESIPEAMDILAHYDVVLDEWGTPLEFRRKRLRKRIDTSEE